MSDLIDRQAAIAYINKAIPEWSEDKEVAIDCLKNTPSAPQWIPMSEREPEFGNYLITYREKATGRVDVAMDLYWSGGWDDDGDKFETIAYMPLPEPYKGDE